MADRSRIEWTHATWNPVTGCSKVSAGCKHCYAERFAKRLRAMGIERYRNGFRVTLHDDLLDLPKRWKTPHLVFVNSMSDLFHELVPLDFIQRVFATMRDCPHHTFQILTKRSRRLRELAPQLEWSPNIWVGVSVENARVLHRIEDLCHVPAAVRFLSCEPLLGPLDNLPLEGIHWVIVGASRGQGQGPCNPIGCDPFATNASLKAWPSFSSSGEVLVRTGQVVCLMVVFTTICRGFSPAAGMVRESLE